MIDGSDLVRVEEVADALGVKPTTIQVWVRNGDIPRNTYLKVGKTYRFDLKAVLTALRNAAPKRNEESGVATGD